VLSLLVLFSGLVLLSGIVNYLKGNPITGVIFALNVLNVVLICFCISSSLDRVESKPIVDLLLYTVSIQAVWALLQSIRGDSFGLPYFGDSRGGTISTDAIRLLVIDVPIGPLSAGRFAGGFAGTSRTLMGVLIILCPIALYRLMNRQSTTLVPLFVVVSTIFTVVVSHTDAGFGAVLLGMVTAGYVNSRFTIRNINIRIFYVLVVCGSVLLTSVSWIVLRSGIVGGSSERLEQYVAAKQAWIENPLFGIGGYNSTVLLDIEYDIHNFFIAYLAELGLLPTIVYVVTLVLCFNVFARTHFEKDFRTPCIGGTMIAVILGFHTYMSLTTIYMSWNVMALFWMTMLIGIRRVNSTEL